MHLIVLAGPTATGKTAIAVEVAHRLDVDVISVDSRQVYRGLDLGTGKDLAEFRKHAPPVRHHLIDIVDPSEVFSLFQYQAACYATLEALSREPGPRGEVAIAVGGTGLYLEAVLKRYRIANVPEDSALREALEQRDREELERELRNRNPEMAARTDMSSKKRIIRALEVATWAGTRPVEYSRLPERDFTYEVFATAMDRPRLRERIDRRLEERFAAGMLEEVAGLLRGGLPPERLKLLGMEYREIGAYLTGEKTRETMVADLKHEIHLLAKRQETYFRGMEKRGIPIRWLQEGEGVEVMEKSGRDKVGNPAGTGGTRPIRVVSVAVIEDGQGRILFLLRAPTLKASPGKWGFCGGGVEMGETPREAMEREIREEIGSEAKLALEASLDPVPGLGQAHLIVHLFKYRWLGGTVNLNEEHTRYAWIEESEFRTLDVIAGVDADLAYFGLWPGR